MIANKRSTDSSSWSLWWSSGRPDLRGAALVGSWVTRSAQMDSDVDVILLTDYPLAYIESDAGARDLGASAIIRTRG